MACNCAAQEQIEKLHRIYGEKSGENTNKTIGSKINNLLTKVGVFFALIFIIPYVIWYIMYSMKYRDGKISIREFLGRERGRDGAYLEYVENNNVNSDIANE